MRKHTPSSRRITAAACAAALVTALVGAGAAQAGDESCRQWLREHCDWKAKAIHRYLRGAPQRELDVAVFELLQREAYLTSCEVPAEVSRGPMVGWRLVGRAPDDYGGAVLESVLERAGLDMDLRKRLSEVAAPPAAPAPAAAPVLNASNDAPASTPYTRRRSAVVAR
jgi:hypothetical protein